MKKYIAAIDGLKFSDATKLYAIHLAKQSNAFLTGIFLDDITYTSYKFHELMFTEGITDKKIKDLAKIDTDTRNDAVAIFKTACNKAALQYNVHREKNTAMQALLHESIYADLLFIDAGETLTHYEEKTPTRFIRTLLTDVQCPVMVLPSKYKPIEKIVILYDGEPSAVHAIKMFHYTLASLAHLPVEILSIKNTEQSFHVPDTKLMKEFMKRHFPKAHYTVLKGIPEVSIISHLKEEHRNVLVITGAYRRSAISRWFRTSMADILMKELKVPVFVAHNK
jgi:nucleotide-binding universal stress UspA family protein